LFEREVRICVNGQTQSAIVEPARRSPPSGLPENDVGHAAAALAARFPLAAGSLPDARDDVLAFAALPVTTGAATRN
jgi:hypothetical protein